MLMTKSISDKAEYDKMVEKISHDEFGDMLFKTFNGRSAS